MFVVKVEKFEIRRHWLSSLSFGFGGVGGVGV